MTIVVVGQCLGALLFSLCFFVFFSGRVNPLVTPKKFSPEYRRVVYFRYVAVVLFLSATLALIVKSFFFLSMLVAAWIGVVVLAVFTIVPTLRYFRLRIPRNSDSEEEKNKKLSLADIQKKPSAPDMRKAELQRSSITEANQIELHRSSASSVLQENPETLPQHAHYEVLENSSSEEYEVEMAIKRATAHIDDNMTDFDQSIAEAQFETVMSSGKLANVAAQPDFRLSARGDNWRAGHEAEITDVRPTATSGVANHNLTDSLSASSNATSQKGHITHENAQQEQLIQALERRNQFLLSDHETLKGEISRLELGVKKRDAALRKSIALKEQALDIKSKALTLAAMERKKRKITEIKAQKLILKLRQDLRYLEVDSEA